ncbi:MAG TPA: hypothetical protein VGD92_11925 [Sphingobacteriaceae bacterium]
MVSPASKKRAVSILTVLAVFGLMSAVSGFRSMPETGDEGRRAAAVLNELNSRGPESGPVRKAEFTISGEGFFRYRKTYTNGKTEYYSFGIGRLADVSYLGTSVSGRIIFKTRADDIIVQTYNDPRGNVDSMATELSVPLRGAEAEDLQLISTNLETIRQQLQVRR